MRTFCVNCPGRTPSYLRSPISALEVALGITVVLSACGAPVATGPPRAEVNGEILEGKVFGEAPQEVVFKGIPFAAPPIGENRWKPPAPIRLGTSRALTVPKPRG